eukprot:11008761-Alexandrium_andersonii.AAC.1
MSGETQIPGSGRWFVVMTQPGSSRSKMALPPFVNGGRDIGVDLNTLPGEIPSKDSSTPRWEVCPGGSGGS